MKLLGGLVGLITTVVVLFGIGMAITTPIDARAKKAEREVETLARDIEALEARVVAFSSTQDQDAAPEGLILVAPDALSAELALQTAALDTATDWGLAPNGFGPMAIALETGLPTVAFEMEFETGYQNALEFIAAIERHTPRIAIETLWIRQIPLSSMPQEETPVSVRLSFWQYWRAAVQENQ